MRRLLAFVLIFALLCSVTVIDVAAEDSSFSGSAELDLGGLLSPTTDCSDTGNITELVALRDANTKHFDLGNGLYRAVRYSEAVHRQDAEGIWQDIDNSLSLPNGESGARYTDEKGRVSFASSFTPDTPLFLLNEKEYTLSMYYLPNYIFEQQISVSTETAQLHAPRIVNHNKRVAQTAYHSIEEAISISTKTTVLYENIECNAHLEYILNGNDIKENIIVTEKADTYRYCFALKVTGLDAVLTESGAILLTDQENHTEKYVIPMPYMKDADGALSYDVSYQLEKENDGLYKITVEANADWINAEERAFPVAIDPSINNPQCEPMDTYIQQGDTIPHGEDEEIHINENTIGFIQADLPALPDGAVISEALLLLTGEYAEDGFEGEAIVDVHEVTSPWEEETLVWGMSYSYAATALTSVTFDIYDGSSSDVEVDITSLATAWQQSPESNYGVALMYASGECESFMILTKEYGAGFTVIDVTYAYEVPEGIYALRNLSSTESASYLSLTENGFTVVTPTDSPVATFDKNSLFIISKVSGTASGFPTYVIRSMANNYATLSVQTDGSAVVKTISGNNASVSAADTFSVAWHYLGGFLITQKGNNKQLNPLVSSTFSDKLWTLERFVPSSQNIGMIIDGMQRIGKTVTLTPEEITSFDRDMTVHSAYTNYASLVWDATAENATVTWNTEGFIRLQYRYKLSSDGAYKTIGYSYTVLPNEYFIRNKKSRDGISGVNANKSNQTFLQAIDSEPSNNDTVAAMPFDGEQYQKWVLTKIGTTDYYKIRYSDSNQNTADDLFLTYVAANEGTENATVMLKSADSAMEGYQTWKLTRSNSGNWIIRPQTVEIDNKCLCFNGYTDVSIGVYTDDSDYKDEWVLAEIGYSSDVELEAQVGEYWCWATGARMFSKHYYSNVVGTQEEAVETVKGSYNEGEDNENYYIQYHTGKIDAAKSAIDFYTNNSLSVKLYDKEIFTAEALATYLDNQNVIYVSMAMSGYDAKKDALVDAIGHVILIYGYVMIDSECWLLIKDPSPPSEGAVYMISYQMLRMGVRYGHLQDENHVDPVFPHCEDEEVWGYYWESMIIIDSKLTFDETDVIPYSRDQVYDVLVHRYNKLKEEKP